MASWLVLCKGMWFVDLVLCTKTKFGHVSVTQPCNTVGNISVTLYCVKSPGILLETMLCFGRLTFHFLYNYIPLFLFTRNEINRARLSRSEICLNLYFFPLKFRKFCGGLGFLVRDGSLKQAAIFVWQLQMQIYFKFWRKPTDTFLFPVWIW